MTDLASPDMLRETLAGLELDDERAGALLDHLERFCRGHGGERHYAALLALVQRMKAAQAGHAV